MQDWQVASGCAARCHRAALGLATALVFLLASCAEAPYCESGEGFALCGGVDACPLACRTNGTGTAPVTSVWSLEGRTTRCFEFDPRHAWIVSRVVVRS